jgi:hypothetical protein
MIQPPQLPTDWLDSRDFYELMQAYRTAPLRDQSLVCDAFEAVKTAVRAQAALSSQAPADERLAFALKGHIRTLRLSGRNDGMVEDMEQARAALQPRQPAAPTEQEPYTTIDMGHGKWEVGAGKNAGLPCIAFGRNGTGKVGEPITTEPRQMSVEETFAVITFANVDGLDVLQEKIDQVREEFFPGTVCQFSKPAAPVAAVPQVEPSDAQIDALAIAQWGPHHGAPLSAHRAFARAVLALTSPTPPVQPDVRKMLEDLEDAAEQWAAYVEVATAPCTLARYLEPHFENIRAALAAAQAEGGR